MSQKTDHNRGTANGPPYIIPAFSPYCLLIDGDTPQLPANEQQALVASSPEEACDFLRILGKACKPFLSPEYHERHPGLYEKLEAIAASGLDNNETFSIDTAANLLKKVPLDLKSLIRSPLAVTPSDSMPAVISKEMVHKTKDANILISEPFSVGWLQHFNMLFETAELQFDHPSNHVQGMLIIEAMRQTGIAMGHIQGLPADGIIALLNFNTNFYGFVERDAPVILRAFSTFTATPSSKDKEIDVFVQLMQWGRLCSDAKLKGHAYMSSEKSQKKEGQLKKIAIRTKNNYDAKFNRILEMELSNRCV